MRFLTLVAVAALGCGDINGPNDVEGCPAPWELYRVARHEVVNDTLYVTVREVCARSSQEACELLGGNCS